MFNRGVFQTYISLVLVMRINKSMGEVTLKVLLQPPMVTLECLILNPINGVSTIIMCPNDKMCFQSCSRICDEDCSKNKITCTETKINNGLIYRYTFDTTNVQNQGEWTCHFGAQQSSTVLFFNETKQIVSNPDSAKATVSVSTSKSTAKLRLPFNASSTLSSLTSNLKKGYPIIKPIYVIILLALFALSLFMNVVFIIRTILTNGRLSSKNQFKPETKGKKSCFQKLCIKFFCVETLFKMKRHHGNGNIGDGNPLLSTQVSNNVYECSSHLQPAILVDNYAAYLSPAVNHRLLSQSMFARSHSFPAKATDSPLGSITEPTRLKVNRTLPPTSFQLIPTQESVSQIIYDDVADPVGPISYMPHHSCYFHSLSHGNPYVTGPGISAHRPHSVAMSLNNLTNIDNRVPGLAHHSENDNEEFTLKDAINSRVELSKEMISHADSLLKRADSLLNDKSLPSDNNH